MFCFGKWINRKSEAENCKWMFRKWRKWEKNRWRKLFFPMLCFQKNTHPPTLIYNRKCWDTFAARNERVYIVPGRGASGTNKYYFEAERVRHPVSHTLFNLFERRRWARKAKSKATAGSLISLLLDKREYCCRGPKLKLKVRRRSKLAPRYIEAASISKITRPFILFYGQN